ncbi:MAG: hypothetical protein ACLQHS_00805 [Candidatus Limnocylindrales bacterium]|jgi:hypothetical protein
MKLRLTSGQAASAFLAGHVRRVSGGTAMRCSCGWIGVDWEAHRRRVLADWLEERRLALRARLLEEEGVEAP